MYNVNSGRTLSEQLREVGGEHHVGGFFLHSAFRHPQDPHKIVLSEVLWWSCFPEQTPDEAWIWLTA